MTTSNPIVASRMPNSVASMPRTGDSPSNQPSEVIATISSAAISTGPNRKPNRARPGPTIVRIRIPIVPPMNEARLAVKSALPGLPCLASGWPSSAVMIAGVSPGTLIRMALYEPPYMLA